MASSVVRRKFGSRQYALVLVIVTTIVAIIASGLKAMDDLKYGGFHTIALVVLVATYVFYLTTLSRAGGFREVAIEPSQERQAFLISPSWPKQLIEIDPSDIVRERIKSFRKMPWRQREAIRGIVARNSAIDHEFLQLLSLFPRIAALDLQGSRVDSDVWDEVVHSEHVKLNLAHGAVSPSEVRDLALTMPEIKICIDPSELENQHAQ
ncbi:MAG: hypothetical protein ACK5AC_12075 [Planctomycetota bacterium]